MDTVYLIMVALTWIGVAMAKRGSWWLLLLMGFVVLVVLPFLDWNKKRARKEKQNSEQFWLVKESKEKPRHEENQVDEAHRLYREHMDNERWRNG